MKPREGLLLVAVLVLAYLCIVEVAAVSDARRAQFKAEADAEQWRAVAYDFSVANRKAFKDTAWVRAQVRDIPMDSIHE